MEVEFRRNAESRSRVEIRRQLYPDLIGMRARYRPDELPHDLYHFVAEVELGLRRAIFGQFAAGGSSGFDLVATLGLQGRERSRVGRKAKRVSEALVAEGRDEMEWSERAVILLHEARHERSTGRTTPERRRRVERVRVASSADQLEQWTDAVVERACDRLDAWAARWCRLPVGEGIVVEWPWPEGPLRTSRPSREDSVRPTGLRR